jgi:uncharacterized protein (DUF924 family)
MRTDIIYQEIIKFWFKDTAPFRWFIKDYLFDKQIKDRFFGIYEFANDGRLESWRDDSESALAEIIILDQFSRNIFRDNARAYENDELTLKLAREAISKRYNKQIQDHKVPFLLMPFMHSEDEEAQKEGLKYFKMHKLDTKYMLMHQKIIDKFGRFPHRNQILGRKSTKEELEFLKKPNSSF